MKFRRTGIWRGIRLRSTRSRGCLRKPCPAFLKQTTPPRILILTGSFGHGHNTAAHNLASAFRRLLGDTEGADVEVVDFFREAFPKTDALLRRGYTLAITRLPFVWNLLYRLSDGKGASLIPLGAMAKRLKAFLDDRRPHAVVTTFPGFPMLIEVRYPEVAERPFTFNTVVTDAISINRLWSRGQADAVFVADQWSKEAVVKMGVDGARVRDHGFPLRPADLDVARDGREMLPDPVEGNFRVLYLPTTKTSHVRSTLEFLLPWCRMRAAELTLVLGSHETRLRPVVENLTAELEAESLVKVLGWRTDVPLLMRRAHVTVTKAGGATVAETLGAQCPVLLNHVVPGQEEGNCELVERSECGCHEEDPSKLPRVLDAILVEDRGALWNRFKENLRQLDRSHASERIVTDVLEAIEWLGRDRNEVVPS